MNCYTLHGAPCRCRRTTTECVRCGREVGVSLGERAPSPAPAFLDDKNRLRNYTCTRCRR